MISPKSYTILDNVTPVAVTSSTDATPIVVTSTAHGLKTGQWVMIYGHATNIAANGIWNVGAVTTNTFALLNINTGASVAGSGAGAGSGGVCFLAPKIPHSAEFRNAVIQVSTTGTATTTLKVAGTLNPTANSSWTNFGATVSASNPYGFLQIIDLDTGAAVNGATGIVVAGTDINKEYEININAMTYVTVFPISWSAGAITVKLLLTNNV